MAAFVCYKGVEITPKPCRPLPVSLSSLVFSTPSTSNQKVVPPSSRRQSQRVSCVFEYSGDEHG